MIHVPANVQLHREKNTAGVNGNGVLCAVIWANAKPVVDSCKYLKNSCLLNHNVTFPVFTHAK